MPCQGFNTGFCCWQAGHLAMVVAISLREIRSHDIGSMHKFRATTSLLRSEAGWYHLAQSLTLLVGLVLPPCFLLDIIMEYKYPPTLCPPIDPSIYLFPWILCVLSSNYFPPRPLDQPTKPFATAHESIHTRTSNHFFPHLQSELPGSPPKAQATGKISPCCRWRPSLCGTVVHQWSLWSLYSQSENWAQPFSFSISWS